MKEEKLDKKDKKKKAKKKSAEQPVPAQPAPADTTDQPSGDGMERAVALIGGKWKLRILWALRDGEEQRFSQIRRQVPQITDVMLSQSLRELCQGGLLLRNQYGELPPRVAYRLTETGAGLLPALSLLADWGASLPAESK